MRIIRIAYRATFEFPKAETPLNPSGWKCPGAIVLEVFESTDHWKVRNLDSKTIDHWAWRAPSAAGLQEIVCNSFEKQLTPWIPMGNAGDGLGHRELKPSELVEREGKMYVLEAEDERKASK